MLWTRNGSMVIAKARVTMPPSRRVDHNPYRPLRSQLLCSPRCKPWERKRVNTRSPGGAKDLTPPFGGLEEKK